MDPKEPGSGYVQSLERGLAVIRAFDENHREMTLSEVARVAGLTRAAARRFLHTLVRLGYVHTDGRIFSLTPRVLELGFSYLSSSSLPEIAGPHLERLGAQLHESVSVSVLDGHDIVYVVRVPAVRIMAVTINIGTRFPAYATSMGRVLLADLPPDRLDAYLREVRIEQLGPHTVTGGESLREELDRVREQGWSLVDQELEVGLRSIATGIRDRSGTVVAAMNVSSHAARTDELQAREVFLPGLLDTAARIEADLHAVPGGHRGR